MNKKGMSTWIKILFIIPILASLMLCVNALFVGFAKLNVIAYLFSGIIDSFLANIIFGFLALVIPIVFVIKLFKE
jgi:hypothetical protein